MSNYQNIPNILKEIASVSSINEKVRIMQKNKSTEMGEIFRLAYSPHVNFGIANVKTEELEYYDEPINERTYFFWFNALTTLLKDLENRTYTGNAAREKINAFLTSNSEEWGTVLLGILSKDLRIGAGTKLINKVYPKLLPEDFCMLAQKYSDKKVKYPVYVDIKLDGLRGIATVTDTEAKVYSRNAKELKNYKTIEEELIKLKNWTNFNIPFAISFYDGEVTLGHFQDLMRTASRKEDGIEMAADAIYNIFDIVSESNTNQNLESRLAILNVIEKAIKDLKLKHLKVNKGKVVNNYEELLAFYNECVNNGFEGIMIKDLNGLYEFKRSYNWMKMKPEASEDFEIVGFEEGTGKYQGKLGAIICKLPNEETVSVGSGYTDEEREEFWIKKTELLGQIIEVKFQEKTKAWSLRFPVFVRFRRDK